MLYALVALVAVGLVLGPIGALIIWRLRRDEPFLDHHGRQALDIVLSAVLIGGGLYLAARLAQAVVLEWAAFAAVGYYFLLTLAGGVVALRGQTRRLPLALPLVRRRDHI